VSETEFTVNTIPVTTDDNTSYEPAGMSAANLGPNLKVEVEGDYNSDNILLATKIQFKQATNVRVVGTVDSVDPATETLKILDITISTMDSRFEDKFDDPPLNPREEMMNFSHLGSGDYVEVRGQEFPADSGIVDAMILERDDPPGVPGEETELRGFVDANGNTNRPILAVLDVDISTDDNITEYFDDRGSNDDVPMTPNAFWDEVAEGVLVKAKGTEMSVDAMFADELELKD
jgi:hypothetical protein